ncbi:IS110 family transposase [Moorella sulfitireducens (nom. illeg.)]|uniref:IS110 family transposase n=1 Tax=Neomoorella sulfitireducens TaxID=2972948 RepID=UPI0021AB9FFB|nr:IS110 family transposase [Moorella sulfitireducens]
MQIVYERCCGLDVHKKSIVACLITPEGKEIRTFGTMTDDILALIDWLKSKGCTHVAMESTGVDWKPIYNLLELEEIEPMVVNAQHIKTVPGRKTDCKDAEWIAELLQHGLLKGSYIPSREQRELRELVRYRRSLINERSRETNRLIKVLEGGNIKLSSVVSDVRGVSGRSMIEALINGIEDPQVLSELAKGRLKSKREELERALRGVIGPHQRMLLSVLLEHIDFLDQQINRLDQEIAEQMRPFEEELTLLETIPGVGRRTAEQILAEIGTDINRFPTAAHLASWAGMCPGNNKSADKRKSGRTTKGNKSLRSTLVSASHAAARAKETYLSAQYHRIAVRRGSKRAAVAVGHSILVIVYHILKSRQPYKELGANYFDCRKKEAVAKQAIKKLESLGFKVNIETSVA